MSMSEMITKIRHIGIIVKDAEKSVELFKNLFDLNDDEVKVVPPSVTKNESVFAFVPTGGIELELIQPISVMMIWIVTPKRVLRIKESM